MDRLEAVLRERYGPSARVRQPVAVASDDVGDLSLNFSRAEFKCAHCGNVGELDAALIRVLQRARTAKRKPLRIVSGWRCTEFNRRVGGHPFSRHLRGQAADVPGDYATADEWESYGAIGIGIRGGRVIHVDVTPGRRSFRFND